MTNSPAYSYDSKRHSFFYRDFSENGYFKTLRYDWSLYAAVLNERGAVEFFGHLEMSVLEWYNNVILPAHPEASLIRRRERMEKFVPFSGAIDRSGGRQYGLHLVRGRHHTVRIYDSFLAASAALAELLASPEGEAFTEVHIVEREVEVGDWEHVVGDAYSELATKTRNWWQRFGLTPEQRARGQI